MLCLTCRHGNNCPYMTADDLMRTLTVGDDEVERLYAVARVVLQKLTDRVRMAFEVTTQFGYGIEVSECQEYVEALAVDGGDRRVAAVDFDTLGIDLLGGESIRVASTECVRRTVVCGELRGWTYVRWVLSILRCRILSARGDRRCAGS